jgi:hypothetical protein
MKSSFFYLFLILACSNAYSQNNINFSVSDNWVGYMNVYELPANGSSYVFGSSWGVADIKSTIDTTNNTLTLQPNFNTYRDNPADAFWVNQTTLAGNKMMEAYTFVEPGATFSGVDLTFSGNVQSKTLNSNYTAFYFIKALDPNNGYLDAFNDSKIFFLPPSGNFSVSASAAELAPGLIIQYGFMVIGANANPADEANLGSVVIGSTTTSTSNISNNNSVSVYPNPTSDVLKITSDVIYDSYRVYNVIGSTVMEGNLNADTINVNSLEAGTYFIELSNKDSKSNIQFVKK